MNGSFQSTAVIERKRRFSFNVPSLTLSGTSWTARPPRPASRLPCPAAGSRARQFQTARRVSAKSELDRWQPPRHGPLRDEDYRLPQEVRLTGDWEEWLRFFLDGVILTSESATTTARRLLDLFARHRTLLADESATVLRLHERLQQQPVISAMAAAQILGVSHPTATKALKTLERHGIVHEMTGGDYRRIYAYSEYLAILGDGTEAGR